MKTGRVLLSIAAVGVAALSYVAFVAPAGPRSLRAFKAERLADLEVDMWQAYYRRENVRLLRGLMQTLHEQYRYSWAKSALAGFYLARAARTFGDSRSGYERVLPDLERGYAIARDWTHGGFDPSAVARAELAWWVARRTPGQNSAEQVGGLIADENALLFELPRERLLGASLLRARAGALRDEGGEHADWPAVSKLLHQSYRDLQAAVAP